MFLYNATCSSSPWSRNTMMLLHQPLIKYCVIITHMSRFCWLGGCMRHWGPILQVLQGLLLIQEWWRSFIVRFIDSLVGYSNSGHNYKALIWCIKEGQKRKLLLTSQNPISHLYFDNNILSQQTCMLLNPQA